MVVLLVLSALLVILNDPLLPVEMYCWSSGNGAIIIPLVVSVSILDFYVRLRQLRKRKSREKEYCGTLNVIIYVCVFLFGVSMYGSCMLYCCWLRYCINCRWWISRVFLKVVFFFDSMHHILKQQNYCKIATVAEILKRIGSSEEGHASRQWRMLFLGVFGWSFYFNSCVFNWLKKLMQCLN